MEEKEFDFSNIILQSFEPATESNATVRLTTNEIIQRIYEHTGIKPTAKDLYQKLESLNFIFATSSDMEFHWLLKQK